MKILRNLALIVSGVLLLLFLLVNLSPVQTFLARKGAEWLSGKLNTKVSIDHVSIRLLNRVHIKGVYLESQSADTLLYAGELRVRASDLLFSGGKTPVLRYIGLHHAFLHLYRTRESDTWNYQFIADAFGGKSDTTTTSSENELTIDLRRVELANVRFFMDDAWVGSDFNITVGRSDIRADKVDMADKLVSLRHIEVADAIVALKDYQGGRPARTDPVPESGIDTTAFNPGGWQLTSRRLKLERSTFRLDAVERPPYPDEFDPGHIGITGINLEADNIAITGDTICGRIAHLSAMERCGLSIRKMTADVTVSPNASICENLLLETAHSRVEDYYAMHYERFPDFKDYVEKVVMSARLKKTTISPKDVAFFAPVLRDHPLPLYVSGQINGPVTDLRGEKLEITDGHSYLKGDLRISGLPDISRSFIHYQHGELFTTGADVFRYAPTLRDHYDDIDLSAIDYLYFNGDYAGYIDNFAVSGVIKTNLGTILSDIRLDIPDFNMNRAVYAGMVSSEGFDIGRLLRQPLLGMIALKVKVEGEAFDQHTAAIKLNGDISRMDVNGYPYREIILEGVLAHKKFDGTLLMNDPNLILAFYGNVDFSGEQLQLSARANLLGSNLHVLNLLKDSTQATADFDLNYVGNNIDDFTGYAKLYHINIHRDGKRLDIDSIYLNGTTENGRELMTLESNDISGRIEGDFRLMALPYSLQYYLAQYLPNYIPVPEQEIVPQQLQVYLETRQVDTLLAVLFPGVSGFNTSVLNGDFNTASQKLVLNLRTPGGSIGNIHMKNVSVSGTGNLQSLIVDASAEKITLGEDILSATLSMNTWLGQDSLRFKINTTVPETGSNATLNGQAYARGDSLYMLLRPSEFFLNQHHWEIPAGNHFVMAKKYLHIDNLSLLSDKQKITLHTSGSDGRQSLFTDIRNVNIAMLGNLFGLASYHPSGQINGTLQLDGLFDTMQVKSHVIATDVQFGKDTIGTIRLSGSYDERNGVVMLDRESGIYHGTSYVRTTGSMSLDSTNKQLLNGQLQLHRARLSWIAPFLSEYLSGMKGTLDGTIRLGGSAAAPNLDGAVTIEDASVRIQMTGVTYTIPRATFTLNQEEIDFGTVTLYDVHKNTATLTGGIRHDRFRNMRFNRVRLISPKFSVLNLREYENSNFYGNLIANVKSFSIAGSFDDIRMTVQATPVEKSHIYIPVQNSSDIHAYSYVSFKSKEQDYPVVQKSKSKFSLSLTGEMNPLATVTLVLDPATGDMINAAGHGTITLNIPADDDMKMFGTYEIDEGDYTFTFRQLYFRRNFSISQGSRIAFNGSIDNTALDINAVYRTRARLSDILHEREKEIIPENELRDAKTAQHVDVLLYMNGTLSEPKLNFNIDLPEHRSEGTYAHQKLKRLNQNDRELFDQVASLLLINTFYPPEGMLGSSAISGGVNNFSEILSSTASSQLTNVVNKILNDPNLAVELKYKNYQLSDPAAYGGINRNEVSVNVRKTLFQDRLVVELGSAYDWGRPAAANATSSNLNLAGDFRLQYLLTADGRFRLNAFRTANYDVLINDNIFRGGIGISYRKSFNTFQELLYRKRLHSKPATETADSLSR